jgi:hypothetical protein
MQGDPSLFFCSARPIISCSISYLYQSLWASFFFSCVFFCSLCCGWLFEVGDWMGVFVKFGVYGIGQLIDCCMCGGYLYLVALFHLVFCLSCLEGTFAHSPLFVFASLACFCCTYLCGCFFTYDTKGSGHDGLGEGECDACVWCGICVLFFCGVHLEVLVYS